MSVPIFEHISTTNLLREYSLYIRLTWHLQYNNSLEVYSRGAAAMRYGSRGGRVEGDGAHHLERVASNVGRP